MSQGWFAKIRGRVRSAWDVLTGRAYAAYWLPDPLTGEYTIPFAPPTIGDRHD